MINILGMMTGTSCDGIDAAILTFTKTDWRATSTQTYAYPKSLRKRVLDFQTRSKDQKKPLALTEHLKLDLDLGEWYAAIALRCLRGKKKNQTPDVIANHGQTVLHDPAGHLTLQMGDPFVIAQRTGLTTISNFRKGDVAAFGQGAPLVPRFHKILMQAGESIHNLGGISNFTYLTPKAELIGFDTGPGNVWIDFAAQRVSKGKHLFDPDGSIGSIGDVHGPTLNKMLSHPYFKKKPPKSTGRDDFSLGLFEKMVGKTIFGNDGADLVSTVTALTAITIAHAYENSILNKKLPLHTIFFCGGGAKNGTLLEMVGELLPKTEIRTIDELGIDPQYVEAQAFAYFGYLTLLAHPIGGVWTGIPKKRWAPPAQIIPGLNWRYLLGQLKLIQS